MTFLTPDNQATHSEDVGSVQSLPSFAESFSHSPPLKPLYTSLPSVPPIQHVNSTPPQPPSATPQRLSSTPPHTPSATPQRLSTTPVLVNSALPHSSSATPQRLNSTPQHTPLVTPQRMSSAPSSIAQSSPNSASLHTSPKENALTKSSYLEDFC